MFTDTNFACVNLPPHVHSRQHLFVPAARKTYHHGDLRNALLRAGAELAESGGPDAVTIRAAARLAGVTPTAAYRHFADHAELLEAVRHLAAERLSVAMTRHLRRLAPTDEPVAAALARLRSTGLGYLHFALTEPGLFRTAFFAEKEDAPSHQPERSGPFGMLADALDGLVDVGYLAPEDRPLAEFAAWSAVHGLALLLIEGPLRSLPRQQRDAVINRSLQVIEHGLCTGHPSSAPRPARPPKT
jgi:AcrR family transcriptional regulator